MTHDTTHTPGPLIVDDFGYDYFVDTNHRYGIALESASVRRVAKVEGNGEFYRNTASLLAFSYNSYDRHCGPRAVELAEADLLGQCINVLFVVRAELKLKDEPEIVELIDELLAKLQEPASEGEG